MKKFKFKLQNVLDIRIKAYEDCQLELAQVQTVLKQQIQKLNNLQGLRSKTTSSLESLLEKNSQINLTLIRSHYDYIEKLSFDIQNQHKIIVDAEAKVEEKIKKLVEALKAKTIMEKLKEKGLKEFVNEFERQQMAEIDDISQRRHGRV